MSIVLRFRIRFLSQVVDHPKKEALTLRTYKNVFKRRCSFDAICLSRYGPASFQSLISPGIGSMIPGSLFSGEFTLGLIAQIRIWYCWKASATPPGCRAEPRQPLSVVFRKDRSD